MHIVEGLLWGRWCKRKKVGQDMVRGWVPRRNSFSLSWAPCHVFQGEMLGDGANKTQDVGAALR